MSKKSLTKLIKENKTIVRTITKIDTLHKTNTEYRAFEYFNRIGLPTPKIVSKTDTTLTIEFVKGISLYKGLEILFKKGEDGKIYEILDSLCSGIASFHSSLTDDYFNEKIIYDVDEKIDDILIMLVFLDKNLSKRLSKIKDKIIKNFKKNAKVPFRDATPKNYILENVSEETINIMQVNDLIKSIKYIDFSTTDTFTTCADDFISILYHYNVPDKIRIDLLKKYNIDMVLSENMVSEFVRTGRFWVRRYYYQKYFPKKFHKRYPYEDMEYYKNSFIKSARNIIKLYE